MISTTFARRARPGSHHPVLLHTPRLSGRIAVALLIGPGVGSAFAQPVFDMREIAPGVFAAEVVRNPPAYAFANSLVVAGSDGVLVVDTQQSLTAARALIAEIRGLTTAPVRWVVNTHWHGDHVNGNQAYAEAFPGVEFIAHETLAGDLATAGAARRASELADLPVSIAARRRWLETGIGPDGTALSETARAAVSRSLRLREAYVEELRGIEPVPPTRAVREQLELKVGEHAVLVLYVGPAHTRGDVVVLLPELGIIAVGDLLEEATPYFEDAFPSGWLRALNRIAHLGPALVLPSHGRAQAGQDLLEDHRALLTAVVRHAEAEAEAEEPWAGGEDPGPVWRDLERRWVERYGASEAQFRAGVRIALQRAREARGPTDRRSGGAVE